jgi:hypothetical protein
MADSDRVLSGSLTKGTRATLTGSVSPFYQGINVKTDKVFVDGNISPRLGSNSRRLAIFKNNARMSSIQFDDTISLNNDSRDLNDDESKFEERLVFDLETSQYGQPPVTLQGEPFADLTSFNPISFIQAPDEAMYPVNLWNLGELPDHEFNGVIEPLDIRGNILGLNDYRYEGHNVRGGLVGSAASRPWGSLEIKDTWSLSDKSYFPFLDAPATVTTGSSDMSAFIGGGGYAQEESPYDVQGYQDIRAAAGQSFREKQYHNVVYSKLYAHNEGDIMHALKLLNSSSCEDITNPLDKRASRGFYFGSPAGSITFGDVYMLGEYE